MENKSSKASLKFAGIFLSIMIGFYLFYNSDLNLEKIQPVILGLQAKLGSFFIKLFDPSINTFGNLVQGNSFSMEVSRGCDGIEVTALLIAGIMAFPADWKEKTRGLLWGISIIGILNILRIPVLYWAGSRISAEVFDFLHVQGGFIFFISISILIWAYWIMSIINKRKLGLEEELNV